MPTRWPQQQDQDQELQAFRRTVKLRRSNCGPTAWAKGHRSIAVWTPLSSPDIRKASVSRTACGGTGIVVPPQGEKTWLFHLDAKAPASFGLFGPERDHRHTWTHRGVLEICRTGRVTTVTRVTLKDLMGSTLEMLYMGQSSVSYLLRAQRESSYAVGSHG